MTLLSSQNKIYTNPSPTHALHGLLMTLRILHYPLSNPLTSNEEAKLEALKKGIIDYISPQNETLVQSTLLKILEEFTTDCDSREKHLRALGDGLSRLKEADKSKCGMNEAFTVVSGMVAEERAIAEHFKGILLSASSANS